MQARRLAIESTRDVFAGLPVPDVVERLGAGANEHFLRHFTQLLHAREDRRNFAEATVRFCDWLEEMQYELWSLSPALLSAYLEGLHIQGTSLARVRSEWSSLRLFFSWLHSLKLVRTNAAAAVQDPAIGFMCGDAECGSFQTFIEVPSVEVRS